jgi:hypothetical protein
MHSVFGLGHSGDLLATVLSMYSISTGSKFEDLLNGLAESDENLAAQLDTITRTDLNQYDIGASLLGRTTRSTASSLNTVEDRIKRLVSSLSSKNGLTMSTTEALEGLLRQLLGQTDITMDKLGHAVGNLRTDGLEALSGVASSAQDSLTAYRAQYGSDIYQGTLESVSNMATALSVQREYDSKRKINKLIDDSKTIQSVSETMKKLISNVHAGVSNIEAESGIAYSMFHNADAFNRAVIDIFTFSSGNLTTLANTLRSMKRLVSNGLKNLTFQAESEVLRLGNEISHGSQKIVRVALTSGSRIESAIHKARNEIAVARSDAQRLRAIQGLVVLEKIKAIQQGLAIADTQVRTNLSYWTNQNMVIREGTQRGIALAQQAIAQLGAEKSRIDLTSVSSEIERLSSVIEPLIYGMIGQVQSEVDYDRLNEAVAWSKRDDEKNTDLASNIVQSVSNHSQALSQRSTIDVLRVEKLLGEIKQINTTAVSNAVGHVLDEVLEAHTHLSNQTEWYQEDITSKLAVIKLVTGRLVKLWKEYTRLAVRRYKQMIVGDSEFINRTNTESVVTIGKSMDQYETVRNKIAALRHIVISLNNSQSIFERNWLTELDVVKNETFKKFNQRTNTVFVNVGDLLTMIQNTNFASIGSIQNRVDTILTGDNLP